MQGLGAQGPEDQIAGFPEVMVLVLRHVSTVWRLPTWEGLATTPIRAVKAPPVDNSNTPSGCKSQCNENDGPCITKSVRTVASADLAAFLAAFLAFFASFLAAFLAFLAAFLAAFWALRAALASLLDSVCFVASGNEALSVAMALANIVKGLNSAGGPGQCSSDAGLTESLAKRVKLFQSS